GTRARGRAGILAATGDVRHCAPAAIGHRLPAMLPDVARHLVRPHLLAPIGSDGHGELAERPTERGPAAPTAGGLLPLMKDRLLIMAEREHFESAIFIVRRYRREGDRAAQARKPAPAAARAGLPDV